MQTGRLVRRPGFTLIELVIVIAILGILAGIAIPRFLDATASASGSKLVADLRTIDSASAVYQAQTGTIPDMAKLVDAKYLAANVAPPHGTMLIVNKDGASVKYETSATVYVLDEEGRATYTSNRLTNGRVEQYLALGDGLASYNEIVRLAQAALAGGVKKGGGGAINQSILDTNKGFPAVEASLLKEVFGDSYAGSLHWKTDADWNISKVIYFATDNTASGWKAALVVVNGTLYKSTSGNTADISGVSSSGDMAAALTAKGFEAVGPISGF